LAHQRLLACIAELFLHLRIASQHGVHNEALCQMAAFHRAGALQHMLAGQLEAGHLSDQ